MRYRRISHRQRFRREDFEDDRPFDPRVLPNDYLTAPRGSHTFVYVSTIQRMAINLFGFESAFSQNQSDPDYEDDAGRLDIPIHAFDVIIADECHRGYTARDDASGAKFLTISTPSRSGRRPPRPFIPYLLSIWYPTKNEMI